MKSFLVIAVLCVNVGILVAYSVTEVSEGNDEVPTFLVQMDSAKTSEQPQTLLEVVDTDQTNNGEANSNDTESARSRRGILLAKAALLKLGLLKAGIVGFGAAKLAGLSKSGGNYNQGGYYGGYNGYSGGHGGGYSGGYGGHGYSGYTGYNQGYYPYGGYSSGPYGGRKFIGISNGYSGW